MSSRRILCILPITLSITIAKRIDMHHQAGFEVEAVAFERDLLGGRLPDCPVESLGTLSHGRLLRRVPRLLKSVGEVRKAIRRNDIVYAFNPDMALLGLISGAGLCRPIVAEIADIREAQTAKGLQGVVVRVLDRFTLERCQLLVVTSDRYFRYYRDWLRVRTPGLVLENKLDTSFCREVQGSDSPGLSGCALRDRPLRIGWFGRLRDTWSLQVLEAVTHLPQSQIYVVTAGSLYPPAGNLPQLAVDNPRIEYLGPYRHPEDLASLFNTIDLVMACYPPEIPSGWSRSNRYYDAALFGKPLIVRAGCADAEEVERHDIGLAIEDESPEAAASAIGRITAEDLDRWRANIGALPRSVYANDGDAEALRLAITNVAK